MHNIIYNFQETKTKFLENFLFLEIAMRENKSNDIFERIFYILPQDLRVENYIIKTPKLAFNPGALLVKDNILIFPRLTFGYYLYSSSIGFFRIKIDEVLEGKIEMPLKTKIILYPQNEKEICGLEDPRLYYNDEYIMLYTAVDINKNPRQYIAKLSKKFEIKKKREIKGIKKDSAIVDISKGTFLTRIEGVKYYLASAKLDIEEGRVRDIKILMENEDWEERIGWSTNAVKIGTDEFLIGWHARLKNQFYKNGFAVVNSEGELLGYSEKYLLEPRGVNELYGDRPFVIFGCGLIKYKEIILWIGGICDTFIGIFKTEINKVLENIKWIKP